jgi:hypothetical protein
VREIIGNPRSDMIVSHLDDFPSYKPPFSSGTFQRPATFEGTPEGYPSACLKNVGLHGTGDDVYLQFMGILWMVNNGNIVGDY